MSTAPAVSPLVAAQNLINASYRELCGRIKTGKLRDTSRNGALLVGRVTEVYPELFTDWQSKGFPTVKQLADAFIAVLTSDTEFASLLDWEVLPKQLAKRFEKVRDPNARQDFRATEDLSKMMAEAHKADERIREQEASKKRILGLIAAFCPMKRGVLKYALRDEMQEKWRKEVASAKDFTKLEEAIRDEQENLYAELEAPQRV